MKNQIFLLEKVLALLILVAFFLPYIEGTSPISTLYNQFNDISIYFLIVLIPFLGYLSIIFFFQNKGKEVNKVLYILTIFFASIFILMWLSVLGSDFAYLLYYLSIIVVALLIVFFTIFSKLGRSFKIGNILIAGIFPTVAVFATILSPFGFGIPSYGYYLVNIGFVLIMIIRVYYIISLRYPNNKS